MSNPSKLTHASPSGAILPENHHFPRHEGQPDHGGCSAEWNTSERGGISNAHRAQGTQEYCAPVRQGVCDSRPSSKGTSSTCTPGPVPMLEECPSCQGVEECYTRVGTTAVSRESNSTSGGGETGHLVPVRSANTKEREGLSPQGSPSPGHPSFQEGSPNRSTSLAGQGLQNRCTPLTANPEGRKRPVNLRLVRPGHEGADFDATQEESADSAREHHWNSAVYEQGCPLSEHPLPGSDQGVTPTDALGQQEDKDPNRDIGGRKTPTSSTCARRPVRQADTKDTSECRTLESQTTAE